jgi:hypothetical protein
MSGLVGRRPEPYPRGDLEEEARVSAASLQDHGEVLAGAAGRIQDAATLNGCQPTIRLWRFVLHALMTRRQSRRSGTTDGATAILGTFLTI